MAATLRCDYCDKEYMQIASLVSKLPPDVGIAVHGIIADLCSPECRAAFLARQEREWDHFYTRPH